MPILDYALRGWLLVVMKLLCKGGWVGWVKATLLSLAIEFSLVVGATVGISFLLRVAQPNESEFELTMRLAEGGDTTAQWNLGVMYGNGEGCLLYTSDAADDP